MSQPHTPSSSISESFCIDPALPDGFIFSEDNTVVWYLWKGAMSGGHKSNSSGLQLPLCCLWLLQYEQQLGCRLHKLV